MSKSPVKHLIGALYTFFKGTDIARFSLLYGNNSPIIAGKERGKLILFLSYLKKEAKRKTHVLYLIFPRFAFSLWQFVLNFLIFQYVEHRSQSIAIKSTETNEPQVVVHNLFIARETWVTRTKWQTFLSYLQGD